jgi:hypothetical protein
MLISCGKTAEAKIRDEQARRSHYTQWHRHFALVPRQVGVRGDRVVCVWLQWIRRKGTWRPADYNTPAGYMWEYRLSIGDELKFDG